MFRVEIFIVDDIVLQEILSISFPTSSVNQKWALGVNLHSFIFLLQSMHLDSISIKIEHSIKKSIPLFDVKIHGISLI